MVLYKGGGELTGSAPGGDNNKTLGLTGLIYFIGNEYL